MRCDQQEPGGEFPLFETLLIDVIISVSVVGVAGAFVLWLIGRFG